MLRKLKLVALASLLLAPLCNAQTYYTVDAANDVLYTVNVFTGIATPVGPLGVNMTNVDLAWHQGALYASDYGGPSGNRIFQVLTKGMFKGLAIPGAALTGGGYIGAGIGGIASNGANLCIAYSIETPAFNNANRFSIVNPLTGAIGAPVIVPLDVDGLGFAFANFAAINVIGPASGYDLYRGAASPSTLGGNDTYDPTLAWNPVDCEIFPVLAPKRLIAVGQTGKYLVQIAYPTGLRGVAIPIAGFGLPPNFFMKGIAREPNPCARQALDNP
jgi:hypothetical protein